MRNIAAAWAVDREFGHIFVFFNVLGPTMGSRRAGRGFKRFLEGVGFILAEFEVKRSHGDHIRGNFYGFWTCELAQLCLLEGYLSLRERYLRLRETYLCVRFYVCIYIYGIYIHIYIYMGYRKYVWNIYIYIYMCGDMLVH